MKKTLDKMEHYSLTDKYYADEYGNVYFNKNTGKGSAKRNIHDQVKFFINKYGYIEYILDNEKGSKKHIQAHRIVASLFINNDCSEKKYVNHIDGNKLNNHISNLEWCTARHNELHSYSVLKKQAWNKGKSIGKINRPNPVIRYSIDGLFEKEYSSPSFAELDGYSLKQISAVCCGNQKTHKGKIWKYKQ